MSLFSTGSWPSRSQAAQPIKQMTGNNLQLWKRNTSANASCRANYSKTNFNKTTNRNYNQKEVRTKYERLKAPSLAELTTMVAYTIRKLFSQLQVEVLTLRLWQSCCFHGHSNYFPIAFASFNFFGHHNNELSHLFNVVSLCGSGSTWRCQAMSHNKWNSQVTNNGVKLRTW